MRDVDDREVSVQAGDIIARRFSLVRAEATDLPGVDRFVATDNRLGGEVTVDIIVSIAPTSVVKAAQHARVVRDRRLTRILAAGFESEGTARVAYVVRERPVGLSLDEVLGHYPLPVPEAAALFGEIAAGLSVAAAAGEHHGLLRPSSVTLTPRGKVLVSGLSVDGELAGQGGLGKGRTERVDALALASLFLSAITGLPVGEAARADLPDGLAAPVLKLCHSAIKGSGPKTLAEITAALGTGSPRLLKRLSVEAPELWWPAGVALPDVEVAEVEVAEVEVAEVEVAPPDIEVALPEIEVVEPGPVGTEVALPDTDVTDTDVIEAVLEEPEPDRPGTDLIEVEVVDQEVAARPRTRFGGAVDDIDEFHDIVSAQEIELAHQPAVVELVLETLAARFPRSQRLAEAAEAAHARAVQAPPINAAPLVVVLLITAVFVAGVIAASRVSAPVDMPSQGPKQEYPSYSFGVSQPATPTP